jgi:hypothetical protein
MDAANATSRRSRSVASVGGRRLRGAALVDSYRYYGITCTSVHFSQMSRVRTSISLTPIPISAWYRFSVRRP